MPLKLLDRWARTLTFQLNVWYLLTFTASATYADLPANTLTYSLIGGRSGTSITSGTGVFTWTPPNEETHRFATVSAVAANP